MYVNFKTLQKEELTPVQVIALIAIKSKAFFYLEDIYWGREEEALYEGGYITRVKTSKKNEGSLESLRLTPKAKKFLEDLETAEVSEEDDKVFEWLKNHYKKIGKEIGNGAKTKRHIRDFRIKSGIQKNNLIKLCLAFLQDEDNMQYNNILEYAFYKAPTAFETRFNLEESRLYKYYMKREAYFKSQFEEY